MATGAAVIPRFVIMSHHAEGDHSWPGLLVPGSHKAVYAFTTREAAQSFFEAGYNREQPDAIVTYLDYGTLRGWLRGCTMAGYDLVLVDAESANERFGWAMAIAAVFKALDLASPDGETFDDDHSLTVDMEIVVDKRF